MTSCLPTPLSRALHVVPPKVRWLKVRWCGGAVGGCSNVGVYLWSVKERVPKTNGYYTLQVSLFALSRPWCWQRRGGADTSYHYAQNPAFVDTFTVSIGRVGASSSHKFLPLRLWGRLNESVAEKPNSTVTFLRFPRTGDLYLCSARAPCSTVSWRRCGVPAASQLV